MTKSKINKYRPTLEYLFSQLPMYQRIGAAAYRTDLKNTIELCQLTGNPEKGLTCIHIAGTNGKGSTSHLLASIFMEAGYKVGLYTSPHLKDFRERITINGKKISKKYVIDFTEKYKKDFERIEPSFFEMTVVMAFSYFKKQKTDIAIIETGMGGRLDSTNVVIPELSVITSIGKDHVQFLGNTLEKIAGEKAGIIKPGVPVVKSFTKDKKVIEVIKKMAKKNKSPFILSPLPSSQKYKCELKGEYQKENIQTVLTAMEVLRNKNKFVPVVSRASTTGWKISDKNIRKGIEKVVTNTGLRGRWETLSKEPHIICDIGHNEDGIKEVVKGLKKIKYNHLHFVLGTVNDKDITKMLSLLPKKATYYFCKAKIPRAMNEKELKEMGNKMRLKGNSYKSVKAALKAAKRNANPSVLRTSPLSQGRSKSGSKQKSGKQDLIFVGGSAFVVAEVV